MIQMHDWSLTVVPDAMSSSSVDISLRLHLRIEQFRHRVSQALGSNVSDISTASSRERLSLYRLLNASLMELEREILGSSTIMNWYLSAARLHLQAFYLLDDGFSEGYSDRVLTLYQTACSIIELCQDINSSGTANVDAFFHFCPFFCYQVFVCAAFVVLKIVTNGFFRTLVDSDAGRRLLDSAIVHLRTISVVNNDLPARLGDVIGFFCTLPDQGAIGGATIGDLRLREVKNRLSMSVVYDSLWIWRKHFRIDNNGGNANTQPLPQDEFPRFQFIQPRRS
jgi:transcriptional regulatory protein LEU3